MYSIFALEEDIEFLSKFHNLNQNFKKVLKDLKDRLNDIKQKRKDLW
jgi:hypothetical protein